jgi:hypothetical protein
LRSSSVRRIASAATNDAAISPATCCSDSTDACVNLSFDAAVCLMFTTPIVRSSARIGAIIDSPIVGSLPVKRWSFT